MKKTKSAPTFLFEDLPQEIVQEICLFVSDSSTIVHLLQLNKHYNFIVTAPEFYGSKHVVFPVGLQDQVFDDDDYSDDELLTRISGGKAEDKHPVEKKKRFGYLASNICPGANLRLKFLALIALFPSMGLAGKDLNLPNSKDKDKEKPVVVPMYYVRNIEIVERGLYFNDDEFGKVMKVFPRVTGFYLSRMPNLTNKAFQDHVFGKCEVEKLDVFGCCSRLTNDILKHESVANHVVELTITHMLSPKKKNENSFDGLNFKFPKLKKLVVKAGFGDCMIWDKPAVDPIEFPKVINCCKTLEEIQFIHPNFAVGKIKDVSSDNQYFLECFENLKKVKIISESAYDCYISGLLNIEELDLKILSGRLGPKAFRFLNNVKKLKIYGGVQCEYTKEIFANMIHLEHLDLTDFAGVRLWEYDRQKKSLSQADKSFFGNLKVLYMCCHSTNFVENIKTGTELVCKCVEVIEEKIRKGEGGQLMGDFASNPGKLVHFHCKKCEQCDRCDGKDGMCQKLSLEECESCKRNTCCRKMCEKCGRRLCSCTKVHLQWGFCGERCEYEAMCSDCFKEMIRCDSPLCRNRVCQRCSSMCIKCQKVLCEEKCIDIYDKDDDDWESIPPEKRVCKKCLESS